MTDGRFAAIIRRASGNDTYYYLPQQLFTQWSRMRAEKSGGTSLVVFLVLVLVCLPFGLMSLKFGQDSMAAPLGVAAVGLILFIVAVLSTLAKKAPNRSDFDGDLNLWNIREALPKLLKAPSLHTAPAKPAESDVFNYGAEKILIVDDDLLVDFFVFNNFHAEQRTLVISQSGYPSYLIPMVQKVLREQATVPVFLLHGSASAGEFMHMSLAEQGLDFSKHAVFDLGWNLTEAAEVKALKSLHIHKWVEDAPIGLLHPKALIGATTVAMSNKVRISNPLGASDDEPVASHFG